MNVSRSIFLIPAAVLVAGISLSQEEEFVPSPLTATADFPLRTWDGAGEEEWKGAFGQAARALFKAGLPDPKGLPYHEVWLPTGNCYDGDSGLAKTEGWVFPTKEGEAQRFAIAWSGLVYPVARLGQVAKFESTARILLSSSEQKDVDKFAPGGWAVPEARAVSSESALAMHGVYLWRLGFPEAGLRLLTKEGVSSRSLTQGTADDWAWSLYDRAVNAHMRGDVNLALVSLQEFDRLRPVFGELGGEGGPGRWATQFPILLEDAKRRAVGLKPGGFDEKGFLAGNPGVAELVEALDQVAVGQPGQPADVPLHESPIVKALVAKGREAIEPLFTVLERDERLTRSVHFWRSHARYRTVLTVQEAALFAAEDLLSVNVFQLASTGDSFTARNAKQRGEVVAAMRKHWERYDRKIGPERWYAMLKDDAGGPYLWARAAQSLLKYEEYDEEEDRWFLPPGPLPGEPLRGKMDPSVSDLLAKRAGEMKEAGDDDDRADPERVRHALLMVLLEWDAERAQVEIDALCEELMAANVWEDDKVADALEFAGDVGHVSPVALVLLDAIVRKCAPKKLESHFGYPVLYDLAKFRDTEIIRKLIEWMLADEESPWLLSHFSHGELDVYLSPIVELGMIEVPAVREALLRALADQETCGEARIKADSDDGPRYEIVYEGDPHGASWPIRPELDMGPTPGKPLPFRRCDLVADVLAGEWDEELEFELYWPVERRNLECAKWVDRVKLWEKR